MSFLNEKTNECLWYNKGFVLDTMKTISIYFSKGCFKINLMSYSFLAVDSFSRGYGKKLQSKKKGFKGTKSMLFLKNKILH